MDRDPQPTSLARLAVCHTLQALVRSRPGKRDVGETAVLDSIGRGLGAERSMVGLDRLQASFARLAENPNLLVSGRDTKRDAGGEIDGFRAEPVATGIAGKPWTANSPSPVLSWLPKLMKLNLPESMQAACRQSASRNLKGLSV